MVLFDVVFLDPPYKAGLMEDCLNRLAASELLPEGGIVVAEHGREELLPDTVSGLRRIRDRKYGKVRVSVYEKQEEIEEGFYGDEGYEEGELDLEGYEIDE